MNRAREWLSAVAFSCACGLAIIAPFFWLGNASGHDIQFHVASWLDVAEQWKQGVLFPRWAMWANYGFGEPRYIFYPPLSWMLGAALGSLTSWKVVVGLYIVVVQTLAGSAAYALARRTVAHRTALFGAVCFAGNPYALLIVYVRSDYAELLAMAFFPLVMLGALRLCGMLEVDRGSKKRAIVFFAATYAAVWLSNAPAGVIISYGVALVFVWAALTSRSWRPLTDGAAGIVLGLGLAGFYLVPAAYEQRWVSISDALSFGLHPSENFLYTTLGDPEHKAFNWIASSVAVLLIGMTALGATFAMKRKEGDEQEERQAGITLLVLVGAATLLMLRPTLILWELLPQLKFVQFPWRWMSIMAVAFAWFLAGAAAKQKRWSWVWVIVVIAVLCSTSVFLVKRTWWDWDDIPTVQAWIEEGKGFEGTDEYDPLGDDHTSIPEKTAQISALTRSGHSLSGDRIAVLEWLPERKVVQVQGAPGQFLLALRLLDYPAWTATVNGGRVSIEKGHGYSQVRIPIPAGESRVEIVFGRTEDRTVGGVISLVSLAIGAWMWRSRRAKGL